MKPDKNMHFISLKYSDFSNKVHLWLIFPQWITTDRHNDTNFNKQTMTKVLLISVLWKNEGNHNMQLAKTHLTIAN